MRNAIVTVQDVSKIYHLGKTEVPALRGVSLDICRGEFLSDSPRTALATMKDGQRRV